MTIIHCYDDKMSGLPGIVPIYNCFSGKTINSILFKFTDLENKLHNHSIVVKQVISNLYVSFPKTQDAYVN